MSRSVKILLLISLMTLVSCRGGSRYYPDFIAADSNNPDSLLTALESLTPEADSAPNRRKEAEYEVIHQLVFSDLYGFADVSRKENIQDAATYFSRLHNNTMVVLSLDALGRIRYSENDFNGAVSAFSEALRKIDWKKDIARARVLCNEMANCYKAAGVNIEEGEYLFFAYQGFHSARVKTEKFRFGALIFFFIAVLSTLIWFYKARKIAIEKELAQTKAENEESLAIAEDLKSRIANMKGKSITGTDVLERLCAQYYVNEGSDRLQGSIVKEVRTIIDGLRNDPSVQKNLEESLDNSTDNVMTRLRQAFPKWKEEDFHLYAYTASGLSSTTIATLLEKDKPYVYNRLYRLKSRIQSSDLPDKEFFLEQISPRASLGRE